MQSPDCGSDFSVSGVAAAGQGHPACPVDACETVLQAIASRRSVRGFLPRPVPRETLQRLLEVAGTAPSGSNIQPWHVHVVTGKTLEQLVAALSQAHARGESATREFQYYPTQWRAPYIDRRRENGWGLYQTLGIGKADREAMAAQHGRNYTFFDAPVVLVFSIDRDMPVGSWLDYGMFLQNVMVAARAFGLHTCPQAAISNYAAVVKPLLGIPDDRVLMCDIALGFEDPGEIANTFRATRLPVDQFAVFME